jgi:hypothetical protein
MRCDVGTPTRERSPRNGADGEGLVNFAGRVRRTTGQVLDAGLALIQPSGQSGSIEPRGTLLIAG